jgi:hypothetical protein
MSSALEVWGGSHPSLDFAVAKDVRLPNDARLAFRWEAFNAVRRTRFDALNRMVGRPISTESSAR